MPLWNFKFKQYHYISEWLKSKTLTSGTRTLLLSRMQNYIALRKTIGSFL